MTIVRSKATAGEGVAGAPWLDPQVVAAVRRRMTKDLKTWGKEGAVSVRFIPSTAVEMPGGKIELLAATTVKPKDGANRPQVFESVVTVSKTDGKPALQSVRTLEFERRAALAASG